MKLGAIIILAFVVVAVLGSIGGTYYFYLESKEILEDSVTSHLETAASSRAHHVETVLKMYEQKARLLTSKTWLRKHFKSYLETGDEEYKTKVEEILADITSANPKFLHISLINAEGKIIISSIKDSEGKDISNKDFFINGKKGYTISDFHQPNPDGSRFHIAGPLIQDGEFLGVVAVASDGKTLENAVAEYVGLGETGEIYLINKDRYMITPSRFREDTFLKEKIDTLPANLCIEEHVLGEFDAEMEEHLEVYLDYRGKKVLGIHHFIPKMNWCLLVEIDEEEAFGAARNKLIQTSLIIILIITVFVSLFGFFVARKIIEPIKRLTQDVTDITKGKLDIQLKKSSISEVQSLIGSLNRVLASLKLAILRTGMSKASIGLGEAIKAKEEAEEKFRILYETSADAIMTIEPPTWKFTAGNPAAIKIFKAKNEAEFKGKGPWDVSPEKQPNGQPSSAEAKKMIMNAMKTGFSFFKWTHKRLNGEEFFATVLLTRVKVGEKTFLQATVRDISKEKESEEMWHSLVKNAPNIILIVNPDHTIKFINHTLGGTSVEGTVGKSVYDFIEPEYHGIAKKIIGTVLKTGKPGKFESRAGPPGHRLWYETQVGPIKHGGKISGVTLITSDITTVKRAGERIMETGAQYKMFFENANDLIQRCDTKGNILDVNKAWVKTLGYSKTEAKKLNLKDVIHPKHLAKCMNEFKKTLSGKTVSNIETLFVSKKGKEVKLEANAVPVFGKDGKVESTLGIFRIVK